MDLENIQSCKKEKRMRMETPSSWSQRDLKRSTWLARRSFSSGKGRALGSHPSALNQTREKIFLWWRLSRTTKSSSCMTPSTSPIAGRQRVLYEIHAQLPTSSRCCRALPPPQRKAIYGQHIVVNIGGRSPLLSHSISVVSPSLCLWPWYLINII